MKKILITTGIFSPDIGGPASYVPQMAKSLTERGHDVQVLTLSDTGSHNDSDYSFGVTRILRGQFKPLRWVKTVFNVVKKAQWADVVYVNGLGFESMLATSFVKTPTVYKIVGDYAWERASNRGWYKDSLESYQHASKTPRIKILDYIRTVPLKKTQAIITPSNYLKNIIRGWGIGNKKIAVVYNAVKHNNAVKHDDVLLPQFSGCTIATVCRLVPWKGIGALIRATAKLDNTRLVIMGDGPLLLTLEKLADELNITDRVLFMGNVAKSLVLPILSKSDLFVLNSTYEGLPHVVLEAMAVSVPVLATDVGGTGEVVLDGITGRLIPSGDEDALLIALKELLENKALVKTLTDKATKMIKEKFVFERMVDETEAVLKRVFLK